MNRRMLDEAKLRGELEYLEGLSAEEGFWNDAASARKVLGDLNRCVGVWLLVLVVALSPCVLVVLGVLLLSLLFLLAARRRGLGFCSCVGLYCMQSACGQYPAARLRRSGALRCVLGLVCVFCTHLRYCEGVGSFVRAELLVVECKVGRACVT